MYKYKDNQYYCDQCGKQIDKKQPFLFDCNNGEFVHFCTERCKKDYDIERVVEFAEGE